MLIVMLLFMKIHFFDIFEKSWQIWTFWHFEQKCEKWSKYPPTQLAEEDLNCSFQLNDCKIIFQMFIPFKFVDVWCLLVHYDDQAQKAME